MGCQIFEILVVEKIHQKTLVRANSPDCHELRYQKLAHSTRLGDRNRLVYVLLRLFINLGSYLRFSILSRFHLTLKQNPIMKMLIFQISQKKRCICL
jgi:hypothetical protein